MSVWTNINGNIKIHEKHAVSIRKLLEDTFTDELQLDIKTTKIGEYYSHDINANFSSDGEDFCRHKEEFFEKLNAFRMDITCTLRFFK